MIDENGKLGILGICREVSESVEAFHATLGSGKSAGVLQCLAHVGRGAEGAAVPCLPAEGELVDDASIEGVPCC